MLPPRIAIAQYMLMIYCETQWAYRNRHTICVCPLCVVENWATSECYVSLLKLNRSTKLRRTRADRVASLRGAFTEAFTLTTKQNPANCSRKLLLLIFILFKNFA